jgi:hypothetical protein
VDGAIKNPSRCRGADDEIARGEALGQGVEDLDLA